MFCQEVGSIPVVSAGEWAVKEFSPKGHPPYTVFVFDPEKSFRGSAIILRQDLAAHVRDIQALLTGGSLTLRIHGISVSFRGIHLPHLKREDALQVWQDQFAELRLLHARARHHDVSILAGDWNHDLLSACDGSEFSVVARSFLQEQGFQVSRPSTFTWRNHAGTSAIDYICVRSPGTQVLHDAVRWDCSEILESDHALVDLAFTMSLLASSRRSRPMNRCGKWTVHANDATQAAEALAEELDLQAQDLSIDKLSKLASQTTRRPRSLRYRDPPEVLELIRQRRLSSKSEGADLGRSIVELRRAKRQEWMSDLLQKARTGDYAAITYFRRRQSTGHAHTSYAVRAGGIEKATLDLQHYYRAKYTSDDQSTTALRQVQLHANTATHFNPITEEELDRALAEAKRGRSAGETGITYEFLQIIACTGLKVHMLDMLNGIMDGSIAVPVQWLLHRITFLPKTPQPCMPKDLRPIVLSDCFGKIFTKILLHRLRDLFPPNQAGQLCGTKGCQALEGAAALQQLTYEANAFGQPLVVLKLDIQAAFDTLSHAAIARFMCELSPCHELFLLMFLIVHAQILIGFCGREWTQTLERGILQGSAYSAELFAKVLDWWLSRLIPEWNELFPNHWCRTGSQILHCILYADDLVLLSTSWDEAERKLHMIIAHLRAVGLTISYSKCAVIASSACGAGVVHFPDGKCLKPSDSFVFLGVLQGFGITSQQVLAHRITRAMNTFWAFYAVLRASCTPVEQRLRLFASFVTSKWRWMAGCVRPVSATLRMANVCMMQMVVQMTGMEYDGLSSPLGNWLSRRRASKMILQALGVPMWGGVLSHMYWSFWGHVARIPDPTRAIRVAITCSFSMDLQLRRVLGNFPDHHRLLQLAWQSVRNEGEPAAWCSAAQTRTVWANAMQVWQQAKQLRAPNSYSDLEQVDLLGRCLLRVKDHFTLLPMRHVPVEPPFLASYQATPVLRAGGVANANWRVYCVGVAELSAVAIAVIIAAPHAPRNRWLVRRYKLTEARTQTQADLEALLEAMSMCKSLIRSNTAPVLQAVTDSLVAVQCLFGAVRSLTVHVLSSRLQALWHLVAHAVHVSYIACPAKDPLYEQALLHAKLACTNLHNDLETFFLDGSSGHVGVRPSLRELPLSAYTRGGERL